MVTISSVLPTVKLIKFILPTTDETHPLICKIRTAIIEYLTKTICDADSIALYEKTCFLDPRFKGDYEHVKDILISEVEGSGTGGKL